MSAEKTGLQSASETYMTTPGAGTRTVVAVIAGTFLIMFAVSPISIVLPTLAAELGIDLAEASWIMTAYLVPLTACLLPSGRLGDQFGHTRIFFWGLVLSTCAAIAGSLAPHWYLLLIARAVQGVGAALVSANCYPIITATVASNQRGRGVGIATMASSLGSMAGTALGPLFVSPLTWRWAFATAAAAGCIAISVAWPTVVSPIPEPAGATPRRNRTDWPGAILLLLTLIVASLSLNHFHDGPETFADGWRWHLPMHGVTAALFLMFVLIEQRVPEPLIRFSQFRNIRFSTAMVANGVLHMTMMMTIFSMPFLMQRGLGMSAVTTAGLVATMQAVTVAMTLIGGWLYDRTRSPWLCVVGLSCVAGGLTILGLDPSGMDIVTLFILIVIMGFGSGIFLTTNNTRIMSALSPEYRGFASGMLETTRQYGHTLGVAVATIGLSGVIGGAVTSETNPAVLEGFALSAAVTAAITWVGVALAAYPIWSRSARISDSSDVVDPSPLGLAVARRTARG